MLEWALEIITKEKTMIKFKFRGFTSFLMFFSFLISLVSGIVLYFPPQGKIAHWTHWTFWGLDKEMWGFLHINSSLVFFVIAILHLYYNWKVLFCYAKKKAVAAEGIRVSRDELIRSIAGEYGLQPVAVVRLMSGEGQENAQE